jgi:2-C-methyl-D-erythritol 4-phosphate cytidylyltransferase
MVIEKAGDGGRAKTKVEKQINSLKEQAQNASSKKEKERINQKIRNIIIIAEKKEHGEEHSNANKR